MVVVVAQSAPPTDKIAKSCLLEFLNLARDKTMQASRGGGATTGKRAHRSHTATTNRHLAIVCLEPCTVPSTVT